MKIKLHEQKSCAFTCVDLIILLAVLAMLTLIWFPAMAQNAGEARRKNCTNNLKQLSLAYKVWAVDNGDRFPMSVPQKQGGTKELAKGGSTFKHFQVLSNEINAPKILICPADDRPVADNFGDLQDKNISYFVGLNATDAKPSMLLSGDRNIENGKSPVSSVVEFRPEIPAHWTEVMHTNQGNVGIADGSVLQVSNARLQTVLQKTGDTANRLALPE